MTKSIPKIYVVDNALIELIAGDEKGKKMENLVFKERELKSLIKASKVLSCHDLKVITFDYQNEEKIENKEIKFIPLWKWLLDIKVQ